MLKAQLRGEDEASQQEVLQRMLLPAEYDWFVQQPKRSVALTSRIRQLCGGAILLSSSSSVAAASSSSAAQLIVEDRLRELESCVGVCERLFGSPIPPTYTRHLSRVMFLWLCLLPVSLLAAGRLETWGVALVTTIAAYVFVGLDEVGMEIENAFQLLPLQQLAAATQKDVQDQFFMMVRNSSPPVQI